MSGLRWFSLVQSYTTCLSALLILQSLLILGKDIDSLDLGYTWVSQDVRKGVPANAVKGGYDWNGSSIYVGRALHEGDLLPAKVIPDLQKAYVPYDGEEWVKYDVEVLVRKTTNFMWQFGSNGSVPRRAVVGGYTSKGEILYIGRTNYDGSKTVGKIQRSEKRLYIPYDGLEIYFYSYEVLVF